MTTLGEVEPQYADVLKSDPISTWPPSDPSRWNILLDAVLVGSKTIPVSSTVSGAPSGKAVCSNPKYGYNCLILT